MTDTASRAPINLRTPGTDVRGTVGPFSSYLTGFLLAVALTAASFWLASSHMLTPASLIAALVVLAIGQMLVHLIFFLHITTAPAQKTNILALLLTLLIISLMVIGSVWIMSELDVHMMPTDRLMQMQR
jgi:cytochrome o ubiquinol oxidase operon protein cyoD